MTPRRGLRRFAVMTIFVTASAATAAAQTAPTPAADETPSVRVGGTIFADFTATRAPAVVDVDGNTIRPNAFNITRAYLNVTGNVSKLVAFRVTPDVVRETGSGSSVAGSLTYRLKYAYAQFNLDDWLSRGSFARLGMQQTPWIDFIDNVYRYRFQGPLFEDREGLLSSADVGATLRYVLPGDYGDVHGGFYNGETYSRVEVNDQKAFMVRATVRPLGAHARLRGLRLTGFHDHDAYVRDAVRRRTIAAATYEHPRVNAGANYTWTADQTRIVNPRLDGRGFSVWATPKSAKGWGFEGLLRYDRLTQEQAASAVESERARTILGVAYWFPRQGNVASAVLLNYEQVHHRRYAVPRPDERRWAVHTLVNF